MDDQVEVQQQADFSTLQSLDATKPLITEGNGMPKKISEYNTWFGIETLIKAPKLLLILGIIGSFWWTTGKMGIFTPHPLSDIVLHSPTTGVAGDGGDSSRNDTNALEESISLRGSAPEEGLPPNASTPNRNSNTHSRQATPKNNSEVVDPSHPKRPTSPDLSNVTVYDCSPCPSLPPTPDRPLKHATDNKPDVANKLQAIFKTTVGKELITLCTVRKGDVISIKADGQILAGQGFIWNGPNGFNLENATIPKAYFNVNPNYKHGALLYRLHHKSEWMCYNTETPPTLSATEDGQLEFLINDNFREDNQGSFDIIVKIEHTTLEP